MYTPTYLAVVGPLNGSIQYPRLSAKTDIPWGLNHRDGPMICPSLLQPSPMGSAIGSIGPIVGQ